MAAKDINQHTVTGGIVRDPELDDIKGGGKVLRLRVASNGRRRGKDGSWGDDRQYFDVAVFGSQAESLATWLKKGTPVAVEGQGRTFQRAVVVDGERVVDAAGNPVRREHYEIVARTVRVMERAQRAGAERQAGPEAEGAPAAPSAHERAEEPVDIDEEYGALLGEDVEF